MSIVTTLKDSFNSNKCHLIGSCSGCINEGKIYELDDGEVFVKMSSYDNSLEMFKGEFASLTEICATNTVLAPKPLKLITDKKSVLVMEAFSIKSLDKYQSLLGQKLAEMHLVNPNKLQYSKEKYDHNNVNDEKVTDPVTQFGFHVVTCCGQLPLDNTWCEDWVKFYCRRRLQPQIEMVLKKHHAVNIQELWSKLLLNIDKLFLDCEVKPSLLHGDLWSGNVGETDKEPVLFDPASFYGHHEFDLAIARIFGGFDQAFWNSYFKVIPQSDGFHKRKALYELFHYLNHWNHFGNGYASQTENSFKRVLKDLDSK